MIGWFSGTFDVLVAVVALIAAAIVVVRGWRGVRHRRVAALALAQSKREGGHGIVPYTVALGERVARRLALRSQLVDAVSKGAFELVWQPQVDARTRKLRGAEAAKLVEESKAA